jgi:DNA helicase-2/ATP-dependent DNA helicase PcrA
LWELLEEVAEGKRKDDAHPRGTAGVSRFVDLIHTARRRFAAPPLADSLRWLLEAIDYKKAIAEEVKSEKMRAFKWENAEECVNALAQYETEEAEPALHHFVSTCALARTLPSQAERRRSGEDRVQLMTLHSAKGLEFPICFIAGLEDHLLPHEKGAAETGIEEERRLFYVGITRAREKLILSMARTRLKAGKPVPTTPSRFLFEIPQHLLKPVSVKR